MKSLGRALAPCSGGDPHAIVRGMKIEAFGSGLELHRAGRRAADFARAGFDGHWLAEAGRTAYLTCAASALAAPALRIGTAVATAFPRPAAASSASAMIAIFPQSDTAPRPIERTWIPKAVDEPSSDLG